MWSILRFSFAIKKTYFISKLWIKERPSELEKANTIFSDFEPSTSGYLGFRLLHMRVPLRPLPFLHCADAMLLHGDHICQPPPRMKASDPSRPRGDVFRLARLSSWPSAEHSICWCLPDDGICGQVYWPNAVCKYMRTPLSLSLNGMSHSGVFTWLVPPEPPHSTLLTAMHWGWD